MTIPTPPTRPPEFSPPPSVPKMPGTPDQTKPPGVMPLIDNSPLKKAKTIVEENKKNTLSLPFLPKIPGLDGITNQLLSKGLGSVFQNPMASSLGQMSSALSQAQGMLGSMGSVPGISSLTSALGNLQSSMGSLSSVTNALSGVNLPGVGQFGLSDLLSHANTSAGAGSGLPAGLSLDTAMAPLKMMSQVSTMANTILPNIMSAVQNGAMTAEAGAAAINAFANSSNAVVDTHAASMSSMGQLSEGLSQVASAANEVASQNPATQSLLQEVMRPEVISKITPGSSIG